MSTVTVSTKYQVVIPKDIREQTGLQTGTALEIISYGSRIELVPIRPLTELQGIFRGMDTGIHRETDRL